MSARGWDETGAVSGARAGMRRTARIYGVIFEVAWAAAHAKATAMFSLMVGLGLVGATAAWISRAVVDGIVAGDRGASMVWAVLFLGVTAGQTVMNDALQLLQVDMADRIGHELDQRVMGVAAGAPGLDHLERSDFANKMKAVREREWIPAQMLQQIGTLSFVVFGMAAALILLATVHPALLVLPFVMVPSAIIQLRAYRKHWGHMREAVPEQRVADHYLRLSTQPTGAKEVRMFGLRAHFLAEHDRLSRTVVRTQLRGRMRQAIGSTAGGALYGAALTGAIAFIGWLALEGRASPGDVALGIQVVRLALGHVEMAAELIASIAEVTFMGEEYLWLLRYRSAVHVPAEPKPAPRRITEGIVFEHVTFRYPGTDTDVLSDVNLSIPAGATVALVGENGAGKSSVVKLLSRFYDPTEGRILVDGIDLREIDLHQWRARMSTAYQDFVRFEFVAREAVGVGDLDRLDDRERVGVAVSFAGADRVVSKLPHGLDTQLGRQFAGGVDLSEGEWQRVALARGSMRDEPAIIVLDEPTASLDARAEHEVFERFRDLARPAHGTIKPVTLLVSHRFSTVRMADLIVVLHEGVIEEQGSHAELLASGGRYAELFGMQASRYG
jgi:ATP-binding cassette subfamily B protein